ncbi:MAG: glycosyltransferase [Deltaproteobacteria bacterium]|nr:glycosyltransferase [Deltaproteobacteria bacterium]
MGGCPAISIVLPFRDAAATLADCVDSIAGQTWADYELIAIDDGSSDASPAQARERAERDPRILLLRPGRIGLVAALGLGLEQARAPLIARMDADDVMLPRRLEMQQRYLAAHPDVALVGSRVELFSDAPIRAGYREYLRWQNRCCTPEQIAQNIYVESPLAHPSVTFRRDVVVAAGGYRDGDFPEDYELWLRLHRAGHRLAKVPAVLLRWREHGTRLSRSDPRYARAAFDRLRAQYLMDEPALRAAAEVVVWGAGYRTRQRVKLLLERGVQPVAWIDVDPRKIGQRIWGLPVRDPEWLVRLPRPFVLVYVASHGAREQIAARLDAYGYRLGVDYLAVG